MKVESLKKADGGWTEEGLSSLLEEEMDVSVIVSQD